MATSGTFTGTVQDGNTRTSYRIDWEVIEDEVVFSAQKTSGAAYAKYSNTARTYVFSGNGAEYMTLSVDGQQSERVKTVNGQGAGVHASRDGWIETGASVKIITVSLPLKGGTYAISIILDGNGGKTSTHSLQIALPSTMEVVGSKLLGEEQTITLEKTSPDLTTTITYECGEKSGTVVTASAADSIPWTPPLALAEEFTASRNVTVSFTVTTYSGGQTIGTTQSDVTFTTPDNSSTRPSLSTSVAPVNTDIPTKFAALYIQGKSRASVSFTASAKLGASIIQYAAAAEGKQYTGSPAETDVLNISGAATVSASVLDSRGLSASTITPITVQPYTPPAVIPYTGEENIRVERSDSDGEPSTSGTYLHIMAGKKFSTVSGLNRCALSCRWKEQSAGSYSAWSTLLAYDSESDMAEVILPGIVTNIRLAYIVQLRAVDEIGEEYVQSFNILTDEIPLHLSYGGTAVSVGQYADPSKGKSFQAHWPVYVEDEMYIQGEGIENYILNVVYPVGSVYVSAVNTDPSTLFGGSWSSVETSLPLHMWQRIS